MNRQPRLFTLDAMRGVAAFAVLLFHLQRTLVFSAYLAVDFFFLLSGFVIARTYDPRFNAGLTLRRFARLRAVRLYPLFAVGLGLGFIVCVGQIALTRPERMTITQLIISTLFGLMVLPSPATVRVFPLNDPGWSLFFEMVINLAYAGFFVRATNRVLGVVAVGFGVMLVSMSLWNGSLAGR